MAQTPIVIGSYCADFTIQEPISGNDFYYYRATVTNSNNVIEEYYLASAKATAGAGAEPATGGNPLRVIKSPFVKPTDGIITSGVATPNEKENFKEFRFKLIWNTSVGPFVSGSSIIASDMRRHITWPDRATPDLANTDRFVRLEAKNDVLNKVKLTGSSGTNYASSASGTTAGSGSNFTHPNPDVLNLEFNAVNQSPKIQTRSPMLMYMVLKSDFDKMTSQTVTATKQMRYLIWNGTSFVLRDLYDPDVTTTTIQRCAYRLSNQTFVDIVRDPNGTVTNWNPDSKYAIDVFTSPSTSTSTLTLSQSVFSDPSGAIPYMHSSVFPSAYSSGFSSSVFFDTNGTTVLNDSTLTNNKISVQFGLEGTVIKFPTSPAAFTSILDSDGTPFVGAQEFVFTSIIADKAVEEFFTNLNVTLLRLARISSPTPVSPALSAAPNPQTGTDSYLGFEQISPGGTGDDTGVTGMNAGNGANTTSTLFPNTGLIVRDYFKFQNPARATQFKFYDLGNQTEYLWQARWPSSSPAPRSVYAYVSSDGTNVTIKTSAAITQNERGWNLEYDNTLSPPGVRLRWAALSSGNMYVGMDASGSFTGNSDSAPRRIRSTLVDRNTAAVFNCIQCSQIDSAGMCIPVTVNPRVGGLNQSPAPSLTITRATGRSPIFTSIDPFRIYQNNRGILAYTVTQTAASPISPVPPVVRYMTLGTQPRAGEVVDFAFTTEGVMSDASRSRNAVFIRSFDRDTTSGMYMYLKYNVNAASQQRVELIASNRPSDVDGFAWIIRQSGLTGLPDDYALYSVLGDGTFTDTNRYLQASTGQSIGALGSLTATVPPGGPVIANNSFQILTDVSTLYPVNAIPSIATITP